MASNRVVSFPTRPQIDPSSVVLPFSEKAGTPIADLDTPYLLWLDRKIELKSKKVKSAVQLVLAQRGVEGYTASHQAASAQPEASVSAPRMTLPPAQPSTTTEGWRALPAKDGQKRVLIEEGLWREGMSRGEASTLLDQFVAAKKAGR